jgi:hypothetical protein
MQTFAWTVNTQYYSITPATPAIEIAAEHSCSRQVQAVYRVERDREILPGDGCRVDVAGRSEGERAGAEAEGL